GRRLRADVSSDQKEAAMFYNQAIEAYRESLEISPNNPRGLRGMAAVFARFEDYGEAIRLINRAEGIVTAQLSQPTPTPYALDLIHERLRISRHKIDLLLAIRNS